MGLRITEEARKVIKDEFVFNNPSMIGKYQIIISEYALKMEHKQRIHDIFKDYSRVESIAENILFTLATTEPGEVPLQSLAGMIYGYLTTSDSIQDKENAMLTAMELLYISSPFVKISISKNGHNMVESMISSEDTIFKNSILPLEKPTFEHKELGSFNWELNETEALDKLNYIPMMIVDCDDTRPNEPTGKRWSKEYMKAEEELKKWATRSVLKEEYKEKPIFFNWAADYRVRMYPVGYYLNPQGNEVEKNMLGLYCGEELNFDGVQNLKRAIASAYGLDKKNDQEKLSWFCKNESTLHLRKPHAKEPVTFSALLCAWKDYKENRPVHHMVELDATNSQAQVMAVLLKSEKIAKTCNVINSYNESEPEEIADLYQQVADAMSDIMAEREYVKSA